MNRLPRDRAADPRTQRRNRLAQRQAARAGLPPAAQPSPDPTPPERSRVVSLFGSRRDSPATDPAARAENLANLPVLAPQPPWLEGLVAAQRWSMAIALGLGIAVAAAYGRSVHVQQSWSQAFDRLQVLQRYERELQAAIEQWKDSLARQAEAPDSTLKPASPKSALFLTPPPAADSGDPRPNAAPVAPAPQPPPAAGGY